MKGCAQPLWSGVGPRACVSENVMSVSERVVECKRMNGCAIAVVVGRVQGRQGGQQACKRASPVVECLMSNVECRVSNNGRPEEERAKKAWIGKSALGLQQGRRGATPDRRAD